MDLHGNFSLIPLSASLVAVIRARLFKKDQMPHLAPLKILKQKEDKVTYVKITQATKKMSKPKNFIFP